MEFDFRYIVENWPVTLGVLATAETVATYLYRQTMLNRWSRIYLSAFDSEFSVQVGVKYDCNWLGWPKTDGKVTYYAREGAPSDAPINALIRMGARIKMKERKRK